jgi:hypothetical protein
VLLRFAARYPDLDQFRWYHIRPGKVDRDSRCWVVGYGVKRYVKVAHFEIRPVAKQPIAR